MRFLTDNRNTIGSFVQRILFTARAQKRLMRGTNQPFSLPMLNLTVRQFLMLCRKERKQVMNSSVTISLNTQAVRFLLAVEMKLFGAICFIPNVQ